MTKIFRMRKIESKIFRIEKENDKDIEIPGRPIKAFIRNPDIYHFTEITVFKDGKIDCHRGELLDIDEFQESLDGTWVVPNPPADSTLNLFPFGQFKVASVKFQILPVEYIKEIKDIIAQLNGKPTSSEKCQSYFNEYQKRPSNELRQKLKEAYFSVPEYYRHMILGDMDRKDQPIKEIIE